MEPGQEDDENAAGVVESPTGEQMITTSQHHFRDGDDSFSVTIIEARLLFLSAIFLFINLAKNKFEKTIFFFCINLINNSFQNMKEEYGLFVWPCSIILAEYVWQQRSRFSGANVVELGAGTSLPGIVAAKVGANVTLTDDFNRPEVLANIRRECDLNNVKCKVLGLTWGVWDAPVFTLCPDIILGADVLYETSAFDDLFATVTFLLQNSPSSVFITAYHNRSGHHLLEFLMVKWGLKCVNLIDGFSFMPADKASGLSGNIQLVEIILDDDKLS